MSRRTEKVESVLQREVGEYLLSLELAALTTISKVEVTEDLKWAKVWITVFGDENKGQEVLDQLIGELPEIQESLMEKLEMKIVPRVKFVLDHSEEYSSHINELLKKTRSE